MYRLIGVAATAIGVNVLLQTNTFAQNPSLSPGVTAQVDANGTEMPEAERVIVTGSNESYVDCEAVGGPQFVVGMM